MNGIANKQLSFWTDKILNKPVVVLFSGKAGVGKTTSANFMKNYLNELGYLNSILPFASGVKRTALNMGWDGKKDDRGRKLLQDIGRIGREYDKDIWVKSIYSYLPLTDFSLTDDWRFPNESNYLENNEVFQLIKIRIESPDREILKGTELYNDVSETSLPSGPNEMYNYTVFNFWTLEELKNSIIEITDTILN